MTPPKLEAGFVRMPEDEFEAMLARAAEQGARCALADVGLDGPEAAIDIHDLRTLLDSLRLAPAHRLADHRAFADHRAAARPDRGHCH